MGLLLLGLATKKKKTLTSFVFPSAPAPPPHFLLPFSSSSSRWTSLTLSLSLYSLLAADIAAALPVSLLCHKRRFAALSLSSADVASSTADMLIFVYYFIC